MYRSTWGYDLADIVKSLEAYCTREQLVPKTTYVWICCVCVNQHRVMGDVPFEQFRAKFERQVN